MAWRKQETHGEETKAVKAALIAAGFDVLKVGHGQGTAWGWLHITLAKPLELACEDHGSYRNYDQPDCCGCRAFTESMRDLDRKAVRLAQEVTGRHGEYDGDISVNFRGLQG
jgi:hypothetical protein